ncbi:LysR substrate-binding domain-containing protein [Amaricoccus tamworthensis]|uniref:LysR substrate-binding domain-containing protein n=1 Tax=Amaricoccus tamworthensis TaxID=57002 RepID=UPI003C7EC549
MQPQENALLELDLVRSFVTVSETGSFTAAAKRVGRTPSAISMQMKKLEDLLGRPVIVRHPRHVTLNPDGEAFLVHCHEMLRIQEQALSRFRIPPLEGHVRFGAPDDFGITHLPDILRRFASTHPLVEVDVVLSTTKRILADVDSGAIDLALTTSENVADAPGRLLHSEKLVWVGARDGRAHRRTPLPLALASQGCAWRSAALADLNGRGKSYRIAYTSETGAGQLAAVRADLAIAPLPAGLVGPEFRILDEREGLPAFGPFHLRLVEARDTGPAAKALGRHVEESLALSGATAGIHRLSA